MRFNRSAGAKENMAGESLEFLCKKVLRSGAKDCKIIDVSSVKTGAWVRNKCQYGCPEFAKRLTCPPYTPDAGETQKILDSYKKAILIHCQSSSKKDISKIAVEIEREAFLLGFYKAWAMGAGPCRLCPRCDVNALCKHSYKGRPSMEACGIDVFKTARNNGLKITTLDSYHCKANYFALVLIE
jgi:predicted metal-binding protein